MNFPFNYHTCGYRKLIDNCPLIGVHVRNSRGTGQDLNVPKPVLSAMAEATTEIASRLYVYRYIYVYMCVAVDTSGIRNRQVLNSLKQPLNMTEISRRFRGSC